MLPIRLLRPGQKLPAWVPFSVEFSYLADGHGVRIGCWCVAWRKGGRVCLRTIFGGTLIEVESAGAETSRILRDDDAFLYSTPLIPLRAGCSITYKRKGRVVKVIGHTDDLKEIV